MQQLTAGSAVCPCLLWQLPCEVIPGHCFYLLPNRAGGKKVRKWCGYSKPQLQANFIHSWCWKGEMTLRAVHANRLKQDQLFSTLLFCFDFHVSSHFSLACVFCQCLTFPPQSPGLFYSKLIRRSSELICRNPWTQLFFSPVVNFPLLLFPLRFNTSTFMLLWFSLWRRQTRKCWINLLPFLSILYSHLCIVPFPSLTSNHHCFHFWVFAFFFFYFLGLWLRTITVAEREVRHSHVWLTRRCGSSPPRLLPQTLQQVATWPHSEGLLVLESISSWGVWSEG